MPLPRAVALLNKRYTNRFLEPIVRRTPGFAVVHHVGRVSGRSYRTPLYAFAASGEAYVISLTYGPSADWVKNVLAGEATMERNGEVVTIATAKVVSRSEAWPHLPRLVRMWLRLLRVTDFLLVT